MDRTDTSGANTYIFNNYCFKYRRAIGRYKYNSAYSNGALRIFNEQYPNDHSLCNLFCSKTKDKKTIRNRQDEYQGFVKLIELIRLIKFKQ